MRGAAEGLRAGEGAGDSVCLFAGVDALGGAKDAFRSGAASGALVGGTDAFRGAVEGLRTAEGAEDWADLVAGVEALLGARDDLRSGTRSLDLAAGVDVLVGSWADFGCCLGASLLGGAVFVLAAVVECLADDAAVGLGVFVCLLAVVVVGLVFFLGGNLGIFFFFSSAIS